MRARTLKPEFWTDSRVVQLSPLARLLFQGLWCLADREGLVEAKPLDIKLRVLPVDACDVAQLIQELIRVELVREHVDSDGTRYLWIINFLKHQRPHPREMKSRVRILPTSPPPREQLDLLPAAPPQMEPVEGSEPVGREKANLGEPEKDFPPGAGSSGSSDPGSAGAGEARPALAVGSSAQAPPAPPAEPARPRLEIVRDVRRPETPPDTWTGPDFWAWAQDRRRAAGLVVERGPPGDIGAWYSQALMKLNGNVIALQEGFYAFGSDRHWQEAKPPLPFRAYMAQFENFVPQGGRRRAPS